MYEILTVKSGDIVSRALDYGGCRPPDILLLHGLAGRGREWAATAEWLTSYGRVVALDQRGHGDSRDGVRDLSRDAYVQDVIATIEQKLSAPVVLVGQSMGGLNAFLAAARRPDLVRLLVIVEATPEPDPSVQLQVHRWLSNWPVPFLSRAAAQAFFGGDSLYARTFAESLDEVPDGYRAAFELDHMVRAIADVTATSYWPEWEKVSCPTLLVGGETSFVSADLLRRMAQSNPACQYVQVSGAGHDLHLETPTEWRRTLCDFLQCHEVNG